MSQNEFGTPALNASNVDLNTADPAQVICALTVGQNDYNGQLGARISALFVIIIISSSATFSPSWRNVFLVYVYHSTSISLLGK